MALVALQGRAEVKAENSMTFGPCAALPVHSRCPSVCWVPAGQPLLLPRGSACSSRAHPSPRACFSSRTPHTSKRSRFSGAAGAPSEGMVLLSAAPGPGDGLVPALSQPPPCHPPCLGTGAVAVVGTQRGAGGDSARPLWESMAVCYHRENTVIKQKENNNG